MSDPIEMHERSKPKIINVTWYDEKAQVQQVPLTDNNYESFLKNIKSSISQASGHLQTNKDYASQNFSGKRLLNKSNNITVLIQQLTTNKFTFEALYQLVSTHQTKPSPLCCFFQAYKKQQQSSSSSLTITLTKLMELVTTQKITYTLPAVGYENKGQKMAETIKSVLNKHRCGFWINTTSWRNFQSTVEEKTKAVFKKPDLIAR